MQTIEAICDLTVKVVGSIGVCAAALWVTLFSLDWMWSNIILGFYDRFIFPVHAIYYHHFVRAGDKDAAEASAFATLAAKGEMNNLMFRSRGEIFVVGNDLKFSRVERAAEEVTDG